MTVATDKRSGATSPSWFLSRAGSTASVVRARRTAPEFQLTLKHDMELIKAQLCAQTKAFEALSHSITLLEQESRQQRSRIAQLEEELKYATCSSRGTAVEAVLQSRIQELWRAVAVEVQRLQASMNRKESSMENLSLEVLESKKILWEELEAVQAELQRIHQKL
ncbi:PREDICTED: coiled-coil domain-containing protein 159, partial [Gekko japonicus]|uniref:Coiled-coil domain-containing protein 159 n=1 Tax=Gekko japonicus TaxID=146911 RepID=A0ABM1LH75_GEKJA